MKIMIDYESSWRNSFLDGSNNEPVPKKGRNFIASMTALSKQENFIPRVVTKDTVMGVLNRLIGDQRKLYQSRARFGGDRYYFQEMEESISFEDTQKYCKEGTQEVAYIRNIKGSTDQKSFTGMITVNDPIFTSDYSSQFWSVLALEPDALFDFVIDKKLTNVEIDLDPLSIINRLTEIKKMKPRQNEAKAKAKATADFLAQNFSKYKPLNQKGLMLMLPMYCSALYLQLARLEACYDMRSAKSKMGGISGISNNGFTPKDFMDNYTTGAKKLIYGNPYVREELIKKEGKVKHLLTKASGQLCINLNIDIGRAIELKKQIDHAGVSSFYLGKKGLAYVSGIDVR